MAQWESDAPEVIDPETGAVRCGEAERTVHLTAALTARNGSSVTKRFAFTVAGVPGTDAASLKGYMDGLGWNRICGKNPGQDRVWADLILRATQGSAAVEWFSDRDWLLDPDTGKISWPNFGTTAAVRLTALMTYGEARGLVDFPLTVYARAGGAVGEGCDLEWALEDVTGTLTISGPGPMTLDRYQENNTTYLTIPWKDYRSEDIRAAVVEMGVVTLDTKAFYKCPLLASVSLAESLLRVGNSVFSETPALERVSYGGSPSQWRNVFVYSTGNEILQKSGNPVYGACDLGFGSGGGSGAMDSVIVKKDRPYTLPDCGFTAPEGFMFLGWALDGERLRPGDSRSFPEDTATLTARWGQYDVSATWLDGQGNPLTSAAELSGGMELAVELEALFAVPPDSAQLFFAVYDADKRLLRLESRDGDISGGALTAYERFTLPEGAIPGAVKLFVTDGDMVPLLPALEL